MKKILILLLIFASFLSAFAYHGYTEDIKIPAITQPVMDEMGIIKPGKKKMINSLLIAANKTGKLQMAVYITKSLHGYDIESFSIIIAEKWKLGRKGIDEGLLLIIAPNEKKLRLETGYGLEGALTDSYCGWIIRKIIIPYIKKGRYGDGILAALEKIFQRLNIKNLNVDLRNRLNIQQKSNDTISGIIALTIFAFLFFGAFFFIYRCASVSGSYTGSYGGRYSGSTGGFSGSGGGFSGGGGGFSGGGGGFGGGGASGGW